MQPFFGEVNMDWNKIVETICIVIEELKKPDEKIIRDDIFGMLEKYCTVIYYPLENESNCGFHTRRFVNGGLEHFVYINTAQPLSKQVFAAAHELGHVWGVAERVSEKLESEESWSQEQEEQIINRFAAELMMPKNEFLSAFKQYVNELKLDSEQVRFVDMIHLMVLQMNEFMVPYEAVRRRLIETCIIDRKSGELLKAHKDIVDKLVEVYASEKNTMLDTKTMKRTIPGLRTLVEEAEGKKHVSPYILAQIKGDFNIVDLDSTEGIIDIRAKEK